jgi:UTP:GlnB (protein PII) uridylyltransferase
VPTHELQEKVAEMFGCEGRQSQQRVETLMGDYFRHARASSRALTRVRRAATPQGGMSVSRHVGRHFEITAEGVRFLDLTRAASRPSLWLELFRIALSNGCAVSEQAASSRTSSAMRLTISWPPTAIGSWCGACSTRALASTPA